MNETSFTRGFLASAVPRLTAALLCTAGLLFTASGAAAQGKISLSATQPNIKIYPGTKEKLIFTVTISSTLLLPETLNAISFANTTNGPGTEEQLDAELGEISLYRDSFGSTFDPS